MHKGRGKFNWLTIAMKGKHCIANIIIIFLTLEQGKRNFRGRVLSNYGCHL